eukprot:1988517-Pyramimonas_sp.AAC.1
MVLQELASRSPSMGSRESPGIGGGALDHCAVAPHICITGRSGRLRLGQQRVVHVRQFGSRCCIIAAISMRLFTCILQNS